jgi:hypothetical protein
MTPVQIHEHEGPGWIAGPVEFKVKIREQPSRGN